MGYFRITTTGNIATVVLDDLDGRYFTHPVSNIDISSEFSMQELLESPSLLAALDNGDVTLDIEGFGTISTQAALENISDSHTFGSHLDVALSSLANNDLIVHDSGNFVNKSLSTLDIATEAYVDNAVAGLYDHKGSYDAASNSPNLDSSPTGINKGFAYTVTIGGTFYTQAVEPGDLLISNIDDPTPRS